MSHVPLDTEDLDQTIEAIRVHERLARTFMVAFGEARGTPLNWTCSCSTCVLNRGAVIEGIKAVICELGKLARTATDAPPSEEREL